MRRTKIAAALLITLSAGLFCIPLAAWGPGVSPVHAQAQEPWLKEFEDVCSKTQDAMAFEVPELKKLIARCDKIQESIAKLDESQKKVYTRRLKMCKDLFVFVLETKEAPK